MLSLTVRSALVACSFVLASCQAGGDALEGVVTQKAVKKEEILGNGDIALTLFLSSEPARAQQSQDLRDGAAMALSDLGGNKVQLAIKYDGSSARLAIGSHLPIIDLSGDKAIASSNTFKFRSDNIDSVLEGLSVSAKVGDKSVVIVAGEDLQPVQKLRLQEGIARLKLKLLGYVQYGSDSAAISRMLMQQKDVLQGAESVVLLGSGRAPSEVAIALRSSALMSPKAQIIGAADWARSNYTMPALEGSLIAMPSHEAMQRISSRFQGRYKRPVTLDVAYGYDAIAMVSAIARSAGGGLTLATLTNPVGFKGALGVFRLKADGTVERPMTLYGLTGGALKVVDPEPEGF